MKQASKATIFAALAVVVFFSTVVSTASSIASEGITQISGVGAFAAPDECVDPQGDGSDYALRLSGDISGCHYVFVEVSRCSAGRAYFEAGTEIFVGTYSGGSGTFGTNYVFTGVYRDCPGFGGQIAGRCQHPITSGSGTDVFEGVAGRIDMRDDVETGTFAYRGHLSFEGTSGLLGSGARKNSPDQDVWTFTGGDC